MLGSALGDALVAAGLDGGSKIEVGVGTGGNVSVGTGDPDIDGDGTAEVGAALGVLGATDCTTATRSGARGTQVVPPPDAGVVACTGAVPKPPAPPGALAAGGAAGVPRVQPAATANGRPRATMPRKTDLGVSRTP
ncbi:hypothetical protein AB0M36_27895 [Actinoplanes sp. NPDC051346]|uniref:hypothetical protein n=1 Tax=Actinoplanes sp. NPDC051346 TaxID=3155048 RepID=UPI003414D271